MTVVSKAPRLAVLIDAENASARIAEALFTEIATLGEASARRIYGDFASAQLGGWTKVLARFAIQPQQNFANTKGKNSGDIALVIDGMDLLHSGRFDGFCLVSSDADFTRLASRIREEGVDVYGFGERKTPESFRQACTRFIYTENLIGQPVESVAPAAGGGRAPATAAPEAPGKRKPVEAARLIADGFFREEMRANPPMRLIRPLLELDRLQGSFPYNDATDDDAPGGGGRHFYLIAREEDENDDDDGGGVGG